MDWGSMMFISLVVINRSWTAIGGDGGGRGGN